jgi:23S rRNA pseudouridine1911/1915/1917 synthase
MKTRRRRQGLKPPDRSHSSDNHCDSNGNFAMPKQGSPRLNVLYEDNHLLVINKPALLATMGVAEGTASVVTEVRQYLKQKYRKPGNVYIGVVSRLDTMVSGVLILARTSKAAARLSEQFRESTAEKIYWAAVERPPQPGEQTLTNWVLKDDQLRRMTVVKGRPPGAQKAVLSFRTLNSAAAASLLEVTLQTGRKHQIRLQLSAIGSPILGDRKYGSRREFPKGIALHARKLTVEHPTTRGHLTFEAPLPPSWRHFGFAPGADSPS